MCTDFDFIENKEDLENYLHFDVESYTRAVKTIGILASPIPITPKKEVSTPLICFLRDAVDNKEFFIIQRPKMRHKKGCFSCEAGFRSENYFVFSEESDSNRYLSVKFSFKHIDGKVSKLVSISMKHVFEKHLPNNTKTIVKKVPALYIDDVQEFSKNLIKLQTSPCCNKEKLANFLDVEVELFDILNEILRYCENN